MLPETQGPAISLDPTTPDEGDWEKRLTELLFYDLMKVQDDHNQWRMLILKRMQELHGVVTSTQQRKEEVVKQALATPVVEKTPVINDLNAF